MYHLSYKPLKISHCTFIRPTHYSNWHQSKNNLNLYTDREYVSMTCVLFSGISEQVLMPRFKQQEEFLVSNPRRTPKRIRGFSRLVHLTAPHCEPSIDGFLFTNCPFGSCPGPPALWLFAPFIGALRTRPFETVCICSGPLNRGRPYNRCVVDGWGQDWAGDVGGRWVGIKGSWRELGCLSVVE